MRRMCRACLIGMILVAGCSESSSPPAGKPQAKDGNAEQAPPARRGPDDEAIAANNRAVGLMGQYDYAAAHDVFADLVERFPEWSDVKVNLAIAALNRQQEGDEASALELLDEALAAAPDDARAHYCKGLLLYRSGDPAALEHLKLVAEADPGDAYAAYYYGSALEQVGRAQEALRLYYRARELDPYLRSAAYRLSQLLLRAGDEPGGMAMQEEFRRLADNPRARTVDFVYTKMGPKAEVVAVGRRLLTADPLPIGPLFAEPAPLLADGGDHEWNTPAVDRAFSVTAVDIEGDGDVDVFMADALRDDGVANAVAVNRGDGTFALDLDHPLAAVSDVNAALWGDYDNDGLTDVYLARRGPNQLWRQVEQGAWEDVTESTGTAGDGKDTVDGALFDADHDGDLDILTVSAQGTYDLLNNNLDGTFRSIAAEAGFVPERWVFSCRQVAVNDLDNDRDADIAVIQEEGPHQWFLNDRLWAYKPGFEFIQPGGTAVRAIVAADVDADGRVELYTVQGFGQVQRWDRRSYDEGWAPRSLVKLHGDRRRKLALADVDGDGVLEMIGNSGPAGLEVFQSRGGHLDNLSVGKQLAGWTAAVLDPAAGPSIVAATGGKEPVIWRPGPGRYGFAALELSGREDEGQSMRSNASGIGARILVRAGDRWTVLDTFRPDSGPGQSLQPVPVGLGTRDAMDFVTIEWSDGVLQSEIGLEKGTLHEITETQRQTSSCPVLFAFDGERWAFVSDVLGVGGVGYLVAPGEYAPPRPWENFLLPAGLLSPTDGRYALKLGEPMEEACYLDAARLVAWDVPPGWSMTLDERMGIAGPQPTGAPVFWRDEITPVAAVTGRGADVREALAAADRRAAPVGEHDRRFLGRLREPLSITLTFAEPLDGGRGTPVLVADGWIEYPYSQTMFAAWQAGAGYAAPTVEARGSDGRWRVVLEQFGYPAGMPRQMSVPLEGLPAGATELRITTNQEIYWDRIAVVFAEPCPEARRAVLPLAAARVARVGFPKRTTGAQRLPMYDYDRRVPFQDTRHQDGFYTAFGPAAELVEAADGALAIIGPGEEIHMEFDAGAAGPPPPGWARRFVVETHGWCKDMDLYTKDGETLEPLPGAETAGPRRDDLHRKYNTRLEAGR